MARPLLCREGMPPRYQPVEIWERRPRGRHRAARRVPAAGAGEDAAPRDGEGAAGAVPGHGPGAERYRPRAAGPRRGRPAQVPRLRDPRTRLRPDSLSRLRVRAAGRLLLQRAAHGGRSRPLRPRRLPAGPGAAVGALLPSPDPVPGGAGSDLLLTPPRPLHPGRLRLAAAARAAGRGGRSADRRLYRGPAVRVGHQPERALPHPDPGWRLRPVPPREGPVRQAPGAERGTGG